MPRHVLVLGVRFTPHRYQGKKYGHGSQSQVLFCAGTVPSRLALAADGVHRGLLTGRQACAGMAVAPRRSGRDRSGGACRSRPDEPRRGLQPSAGVVERVQVELRHRQRLPGPEFDRPEERRGLGSRSPHGRPSDRWPLELPRDARRREAGALPLGLSHGGVPGLCGAV